MARKYVTDIIGDDYKNWCPSDKILISQGTGSGKTWFILRVLLKYAKEQGKHLVYLCNRKFLSQQVQAEAKKLLLNEVGEDKDGLTDYLHIRTYQHSELVRDVPRIKAVDENGKIKEYRDVEGKHISYEYETTEDDVLYYVYDEAFYMIADAGFNANTHYWYNKNEIWNNPKSISVFLAATPEPLLLYMQFRAAGRPDLLMLCEKYVAAHFINKNNHRERWMRYYHRPYLTLAQECNRICSIVLPSYHPKYYALEGEKAESVKRAEQKANEIVEECSNPYKDLFDEVERAYNTGSRFFDYVYEEGRSLQERYDYLNTYYFDDMETLAKIIAMSVQANHDKDTKESDKQRWLVFVRRYEDAVALRTSLRILGCKAVAISAKITKNYDGSPCKRKGTVKKTLETLVHKQELNCDVCLTTSVLDCGFSLKSENVNNLAVCQPDKTSFLQMIGRIRVAEGQRVNLYVRSFSPSEVRGHRDESVNMFLYLSQLYLKDEEIHRSTLGYGSEPNMKEGENLLVDGMISLLPTATLHGLLEKLDNDRNRKNYMYYDDRGNKDLRVSQKLSPKVNPSAMIYYLSQVYFYKVQLPKYEDDPYYFLKEQLSWIGKTYDPERWIDYHSSREALNNFLAERCTEIVNNKPVDMKKGIDKDAQLEFRRECLELLRVLRLPPESVQEEKRHHSKGSNEYTGKDKLNGIFVDIGLPYQIMGRQNKKLLIDKDTGERVINPKTGKPKYDNTTYWYVYSADVDALRPGLEKEREDRRIERARKKEERTQQKEQELESQMMLNSENSPEKTGQTAAMQPEIIEDKKTGLKIRLMRGDKPYNQNK